MCSSRLRYTMQSDRRYAAHSVPYCLAALLDKLFDTEAVVLKIRSCSSIYQI